METMFELASEALEVYIEAATKEKLSEADKEKLISTLKRLEIAGDNIVKKVSADLKRTFTPPFSQVDLRNLFGSLDNVLDRLDESAKICIHGDYRSGFPSFVLDQLKIMRKGMVEAKNFVDLLRNPRNNAERLGAIVAKVGSIESEGDRIYWPKKKEIADAINAAAKENHLEDYRRAVMDEKMLDQMERLIDMLVLIMRGVEGMIIEHA